MARSAACRDRTGGSGCARSQCPRRQHLPGARGGRLPRSRSSARLVLTAALSAACAAAPLCSTDWARPSPPRLRLRGGSSAPAVGAPWDGVGAPGCGDIFREQLRPLGATAEQRPLAMTVPGTHANMSHAIASVGDGEQTILACSGDHRWAGVLATAPAANGTIDVRGEAHTRLMGRWRLASVPLFHTSSRGSFVHLTCAYATDDYDAVHGEPHALCEIMGGPWRFEECHLRAAAADVLACFSVANADVTACVLGGMGPYDADNGTMLAVGGVVCDDDSVVCLRESAVEYCGQHCASAVEAREHARLLLNASTLRYNLVGGKVDDGGVLEIRRSYLLHNYLCQMIVGDNAEDARIVCIDTHIEEGPERGQSPLWLHTDNARPGTLEMHGNVHQSFAPPPPAGVDGAPRAAEGEDGIDEDAEVTDPPLPLEMRMLSEDEWATHPDLTRLDVALKLLKLEQEERVLSDSEAETQRILDRIDAEEKAECAALQALPPFVPDLYHDDDVSSETSI
eukprot:Tamp_13882.p1 GENE.Tamp_13882~~Tamp_13882.p1  ORF type:complete len:511 (-),score=91.76 Tamp_13882:72-1604(-)